jgi:RNA polymerase sigma-70 factor (ECF subfamily)
MGQANGRSKLVELEKVITDFQDQLFRFAFFRTGCFADSQDIVQEVFIKLYHENDNLNSVNNMKSYLYRSISNACTDYFRKKKNLRFEPIDKNTQILNMQEKESSYGLIQIEEYNRLEKLLNELPDEQSETIRLKVFDNLSFVEIAEIFDIPVTTIKSRFHYGIEKLKNRIETIKDVSYGL